MSKTPGSLLDEYVKITKTIENIQDKINRYKTETEKKISNARNEEEEDMYIEEFRQMINNIKNDEEITKKYRKLRERQRELRLILTPYEDSLLENDGKSIGLSDLTTSSSDNMDKPAIYSTSANDKDSKGTVSSNNNTHSVIDKMLLDLRMKYGRLSSNQIVFSEKDEQQKTEPDKKEVYVVKKKLHKKSSKETPNKFKHQNKNFDALIEDVEQKLQNITKN